MGGNCAPLLAALVLIMELTSSKSLGLLVILDQVPWVELHRNVVHFVVGVTCGAGVTVGG